MQFRLTIYFVVCAVVSSVRLQHSRNSDFLERHAKSLAHAKDGSHVSQWGLRKGTQYAFTHGRFFRFHVPRAYRRMRRTPLVFVFHGTGLGPACSLHNFGHIRMAERHNFIAVGGLAVGPNWNIGNCEGPSPGCRAKDVVFFRNMVGWFKSRTYVDKNAILVTGFSRGGFMSYRIACAASDLVAVAGVVAGGLIGDCKNQKRPVSVIHFHGTTDLNVPFSCGPRAIRTYRHKSATKCKGPIKTVFKNSNATCEAFTNCAGGASVHFCTMRKMHHSWPGAQKFCSSTAYSACCGCSWADGSVDALQYVWTYFTKNRRRMGRPPQGGWKRRGSLLQLPAAAVDDVAAVPYDGTPGHDIPSRQEDLELESVDTGLGSTPEEDDREIGVDGAFCGVEGCALCNNPDKMTDLPCSASEAAAIDSLADCAEGSSCGRKEYAPLAKTKIMPAWRRSQDRRPKPPDAQSRSPEDTTLTRATTSMVRIKTNPKHAIRRLQPRLSIGLGMPSSGLEDVTTTTSDTARTHIRPQGIQPARMLRNVISNFIGARSRDWQR